MAMDSHKETGEVKNSPSFPATQSKDSITDDHNNEYDVNKKYNDGATSMDGLNNHEIIEILDDKYSKDYSCSYEKKRSDYKTKRPTEKKSGQRKSKKLKGCHVNSNESVR